MPARKKQKNEELNVALTRQHCITLRSDMWNVLDVTESKSFAGEAFDIVQRLNRALGDDPRQGLHETSTKRSVMKDRDKP